MTLLQSNWSFLRNRTLAVLEAAAQRQQGIVCCFQLFLKMEEVDSR